jgi:hypothetical protein
VVEAPAEASSITHTIQGLERGLLLGFLLLGGGSCLQCCLGHKTGVIWELPGEVRRKEIESKTGRRGREKFS